MTLKMRYIVDDSGARVEFRRIAGDRLMLSMTPEDAHIFAGQIRDRVPAPFAAAPTGDGS